MCINTAVDYRLAWYAPYPAQIIDAIAAWAHLVENLDIPPSNIVVSGDSAGANLAIALVRHLRDMKFDLPAGLVLHSPWTDMTFVSTYLRKSFSLILILLLVSSPTSLILYFKFKI